MRRGWKEVVWGAPRLLRVNEITRPGSYSLDDPTKVSELVQLGSQAAKDEEVLRQVRSRFLNGRTALPWRTETGSK